MQIDASRYGKKRLLQNPSSFRVAKSSISLTSLFPVFTEKSLQQDLLDFQQGARGQDFHDITLMVDGEPVVAHKVLNILSFHVGLYPILYDH